MTFPEEALPPAPVERADWPVSLRTGSLVPFDVLVSTWLLVSRHLNPAAGVALLMVVAGHWQAPRSALLLLRACGLIEQKDLNQPGTVPPAVRDVVRACAPEVLTNDVPGKKGQRVLVGIRWTPPVDWLR